MDRAESARLDSLRSRVLEVLQTGRWYTLAELVALCGGSPTGTGVAAKLRDLRKARYGGHTIVAEPTGAPGCWRYRLVPRPPAPATGPAVQLGLPLA